MVYLLDELPLEDDALRRLFLLFSFLSDGGSSSSRLLLPLKIEKKFGT